MNLAHRYETAERTEKARYLAEAMIDQRLIECEETGVTRADVTGLIDDYDKFDELVFESAAGSLAAARLLRELLVATATPLIEAELKKHDARAEEAVAVDRFGARKAFQQQTWETL